MWLLLAAVCVGGVGTLTWLGTGYVVGRTLQAWTWVSAACERLRGPPPPAWVGLDAAGGVAAARERSATRDWRVCYRQWRVDGRLAYAPPDAVQLPARTPLPTLTLIISHGGRSVDFQRDLSAYAYEGNTLFGEHRTRWLVRDHYPGVDVGELKATYVCATTYGEKTVDLRTPVVLGGRLRRLRSMEWEDAGVPTPKHLEPVRAD